MSDQQTAVDLDALDKLRAVAAEWMRTHLFWGLDPSKAPEAAEMLFALPEFTDLIADARRYRALREAAVARLSPDGELVAIRRGANDWRVSNGGHYRDQHVADWTPLAAADQR